MRQTRRIFILFNLEMGAEVPQEADPRICAEIA